MDKAHEKRMTDFLTDDDWFSNPSVARKILDGVPFEEADSQEIGPDFFGSLRQIARVQHLALIELAKQLDELSEDK